MHCKYRYITNTICIRKGQEQFYCHKCAAIMVKKQLQLTHYVIPIIGLQIKLY